MLSIRNGCYGNSKYFIVFSDGAEEEKMETETNGQQSEKVSLAQYAGSEKSSSSYTPE